LQVHKYYHFFLQNLLPENEKTGNLAKGKTFTEGYTSDKDGDHLVVDIHEGEASGGDKTPPAQNQSVADLYRMAQNKKESILKRLKKDTEGTIVLVGALESLSKPLVALVRLFEGIIMPNALEVPLPMRFVFIVLTPKPSPNMDFHEVGRSFSTLMSNPKFHNVCYAIEERKELLSAINDFLDESVVLPPGDWDRNNLLSVTEINDMRRRRKQRQATSEVVAEEREEDISDEGFGGEGDPESGVIERKRSVRKEDDEKKRKKDDPMIRTNVPFGGVINDWKRRFPWYISDFVDGLNSQCLAAAIFIFFACLSGAIAFGGITATKTNNQIGIPETLVVSAVAGLLFHLFSGMPLIITGVTGPVLLFEETLFQFIQSIGLESDFLLFRVWIGIWIVVIALTVAAFQGSTLVKHFTKFTKDIFASLVALLFIYEALRKLSKIFKAHPLAVVDTYCSQEALNSTSGAPSSDAAYPNTALLSAILMFGTFFIAYFLRIFRNGKYLGRTVRSTITVLPVGSFQFIVSPISLALPKNLYHGN